MPYSYLISRSKLVPDFALTIHFIHLVITSFYTHAIPSNLLWWGLQGASAALMTFVGMWVCQYRDLRPIAFGGSSSNQRRVTQPALEAAAEQEDAEPAGFSRGRGRGRNRDGGGEYEMVAVKEHSEVPV
ncbi:hypothetical protein PRK78_005962 [Emydomyces testavorans]|uniref:Uncharacterized protein n=1 Tax=Emydomyces testavorans TaxID=2070801 RepID=A0AAF0IL82_9EURO|nr:hypothetical protein PRK78_005962 [Emydomyces testavorans]